jgi:hypothetical protein
MMPLDLHTVKGLIKQELELAELPVSETFGGLRFQSWQINRIQATINTAFKINLRPMWGETVMSYTDRLLNSTPKKISTG